MALKITDTEITSDEVSAYAEWSPNRAAAGDGAWVINGVSGKLASSCFDRNQAISAMTILEERARPNPRLLLIKSLESELNL
jgi:hypothetical protein